MSTARFNTLGNLAGTKSVPVNTVVDGSAKAWVNFDGTGTVAIRAAFNVSSITDNGTGDYTVNFTTAMSDANYALAGTALKPTATINMVGVMEVSGGIRTASSVEVLVQQNTAAIDSTSVSVIIYR